MHISDAVRIHRSWLKTGIMQLSQFKTDVDVAGAGAPVGGAEIEQDA